jgi:2-polyprenyl-6-methoxyphenol hydroxylase-like FAD-dependent oxidoreductase
MRVLVIGAGMAGLTTALALGRDDHEITIIERAPGPRDEGYMLDFFGPGYDAAEDLGLLAAVEQARTPVSRIEFCGPGGEVRASLPYSRLRDGLFGGRHVSILRGHLEHVLRNEVAHLAELRFDRTVTALTLRSDAVVAAASDGTEATYDLVVGADGVHSATRRMLWGPDERFVVDMGHVSIAFVLGSAPGGIGAGVFRAIEAPGSMAAAYPIGDGQAAALFVHRTGDAPDEAAGSPIGVLETHYGRLGGFVPELLDRARDMDPHQIFLDTVDQVVLDRWSAGRVALVGDAAWSVSLLAGQGASLAVAGGRSLAGALDGASPAAVPSALAHWEEGLRGTVTDRQRAGRRMVKWFVPVPAWRRLLRETGLRALGTGIAGRLIGRSLLGRRTTA